MHGNLLFGSQSQTIVSWISRNRRRAELQIILPSSCALEQIFGSRKSSVYGVGTYLDVALSG
jgi:hypothetical protein